MEGIYITAEMLRESAMERRETLLFLRAECSFKCKDPAFCFVFRQAPIDTFLLGIGQALGNAVLSMVCIASCVCRAAVNMAELDLVSQSCILFIARTQINNVILRIEIKRIMLFTSAARTCRY